MSSSSSPPMSPTPSPCTAGPPFDNADADVILRSADGVDFRVFKVILSLASPVFKSMFSLPQPSDQTDPPHVIELPENSATLEPILLLCYPGTKSTLPSFSNVPDFAAALIKYDMEAVMQDGKEVILSQFLEKHPVSLYALACKYGWRDVAESAAAETLKIKDLGRTTAYVDEMESMSAATYQRLISYHIACGEIAQKIALGHEPLRIRKRRQLMKELRDDPVRYRRVAESESKLWCSSFSGPWFDTYQTSIARELRSRPSPSTLYDAGSTFFNNAVGTILGQVNNKASMYASLEWGRRTCSKDVEEEIPSVKLEFKS